MLLLLIVFFFFSTCTVLLEYYAVQHYYRRQARRKKGDDDITSNAKCETTAASPSKSASAPALMKTPTGSEAGDPIPRAIVCPSSRRVSLTPLNNNKTNSDDIIVTTTGDVVSSQTIRKKESLPLPDGSTQTIVHIRNRAVLADGSVKETITVKVVEEDGNLEKEMEQTASSIIHPVVEPRQLGEEFDKDDDVKFWTGGARRNRSCIPPAKKYPERLLQPTLSPPRHVLSKNTDKLMDCYSITQEPQYLLPKNKYAEPKVAMDGENAVIACKQSIHFFSYQAASSQENNLKWREVATIHMPHIYCAMSVAVSGNTAVVGVPKDSTIGAVYIYEKQNDDVNNSTGVWKEVSKFVPPCTAEDNYRGANVGYSVDIDGDTIVVGAPSKDSISRKGAVYVLKRCKAQCLNDGWALHSRLERSSYGDCDTRKNNFGSVVSICKNVIATSNGVGPVAVFKYDRNFDLYTETKGSLIDESNQEKHCASLAVTADGGVVVGCKGSTESGALFYHTNHPGPSSEQYILHQNPTGEEMTGENSNLKRSQSQVSVCERTKETIMIMGAYNTSGKHATADQVHIYKRSTKSWNKVAVIDNLSNLGTMFGNSVAVSRNQIMIASSNNVYAYNLEF
jgi:hypothetical protein